MSLSSTASRRRTERIADLHALMTQALAGILAEVGAAAEDGVYGAGATGLVTWLTAELQIAPRTARAWVRAARKLDDFPAIAQRLAEGSLAFDQAQALLRYLDPEDESIVVDAVLDTPAAELERAARRQTPRPQPKVAEDRFHRRVEMWWDDEQRWLHFKGALPGVDGALFEKAVQHLALTAPHDSFSGLWRPFEERAADALIQMASLSLGGASNADRATVVVHAPLSALVPGSEATADVEFGPVISAIEAQRLSCDGRIQLITTNDDGTPVGVGRTTRRIPFWLERLVRQRDGGCRFPGCRRTRWTQVHHIVHWAHGGPTDLDNLIVLCGYHHRMLHDEGWAIVGRPDGELRWITPQGGEHTPKPLRDPPHMLDFRLDAVNHRFEQLVATARGKPPP